MQTLKIIFICIFILIALSVCTKKLLGEVVTEEDIYDNIETFRFFYEAHRFEYQGHLWWPIMLEHHPECKCRSLND